MITRYPLQWPVGWRRAKILDRQRGKFNRRDRVEAEYQMPGTATIYRQVTKHVTVADAVDRVYDELSKLGVANLRDDAVISTNLVTTLNGRPRSALGEPADPGSAVYWERYGVRQCMAIDRYDRVADNLAAIAATLEAMRAIERHGGAEILNRAFTGFAALPERSGSNWRLALGFISNQSVTLDEAEAKFRELAKRVHSDQGGDDDAMRRLIEARNEAKAELAPVNR